MFPVARRYLLVIGLLLAGLAVTWVQRWQVPPQPVPALTPMASGQTDAPKAGTGTAMDHLYFLDVEGWYRVTPYETVVRSPYNLTGRDDGSLAAALPATVGEWQQVGQDEYVGDDPAVVEFLGQPTVALQRTYRDTAGQHLSLVLIGNEGNDSYLLFSHTPETCYPGRLWQVIEERRESAILDPGGGGQPMYAQYLLTQQAETGERLMVLFWYQWDSPARDPEEGVLSVRVNLFLAPDQSEEDALARAWDFVRGLFPTAVTWERF